MVELIIENIHIPVGATFTHESTSWQVSKTSDFTDVNQLIVNVVESTTSKLKYDLDYTLFGNEVLYSRVKYHFDNNEATEWTYPLKISKGESNTSNDMQYIKTPTLTSRLFEENDGINMVITASSMTVVTGNATHKATSWYIYDTAGVLLHSREYDEDNKLSFRIPDDIANTLLDYNIVTVRAIFIDSLNNESYAGKKDIFFKVKNNLIAMSHVINLFTSGNNRLNPSFNFPYDSSYSYIVTDKHGGIIVNGESDVNVDFVIPGSMLKEDYIYNVFVVGKRMDGTRMESVFKLTAVRRRLFLDSVNNPIIELRSENVNDDITNAYDCITEETTYEEVPVFMDGDNLVFFRKSTGYKVSKYNYTIQIPNIDESLVFKLHTPYDDHLVVIYKDDNGVNIRTFQNIKNSSRFSDVMIKTVSYYDTLTINDEVIGSVMIQDDELMLSRVSNGDVIIYSINIFTGVEKIYRTILNADMNVMPSISYLANNKLAILGKHDNVNKGYILDIEEDTLTEITVSNDILNDTVSMLRSFRANDNVVLVTGRRASDDKLVKTLVNVNDLTWNFDSEITDGEDNISLLTKTKKLVIFN